ncbi:MAG: HPP family protein [Halolamina sp.]
MVHNAARAGFRASLLLVVTGVVTVLTGRPFLFPSLGPSAYLLATAPTAPTSQPRNVIGGHAIGVVAGLLTYHLLASGLVVTDPASPLSLAQLRLGASAVLSVGLTTAGMVAADYRHAPACATTLIVGLGLLPSPVDGAIILAAVVLLVASQSAMTRNVA